MKTAAILVSDFVQEEEYLFPYYLLQMEGFELDVVLSPHKNNMSPKGKYGIPLKWNKLSSDVQDNVYDLIVLPGGFCPEIVRLDNSALKIVDNGLKNNSVIAAICHGPQVLLSVHYHLSPLNINEMTGFIGIKDDILNAGFNYSSEPVVVDGNIITANHYNANPEWMKRTLELCIN